MTHRTTMSFSRVHLLVQGRVQGIGYRWFVQRVARELGITGWVRNLDTGDVEVEAEGERAVIDQFIGTLRTGHPYATVDAVDASWLPGGEERRGDFEITR